MPPDIGYGKRAKERFQVLNCNVRIESKGVLGRFGSKAHCASLINLSTSGMQVVCYDMLKGIAQHAANRWLKKVKKCRFRSDLLGIELTQNKKGLH